MPKSKAVLTYDNFSCFHIDMIPKAEIQNFSLEKLSAQGLASYFINFAFDEEKDHLAKTYVIKENGSHLISAYFTLRAGSIPLKREKSSSFDALPGIELAALAVNDNFRKMYPGFPEMGTYFFTRFILPIAKSAAEIIGIHSLYIFALDEEPLIEHYSEWGFSRLKPKEERFVHAHIKPKFDKGCIFMYQSLF